MPNEPLRAYGGPYMYLALSYFQPLVDEYTLGKGEYLVAGDNRYNSHDGREWNGPDLPILFTNDVTGDVGVIDKSLIVGRVRRVILPFKNGRAVENDPTYLNPVDR